MHALRLTAHPEFWWPASEWEDPQLNRVNDFVHCIAAVERILLPEPRLAPAGMQLTPTFGQHAAVLTSRSRDNLQEWAVAFSALYRLRSRLIHGEKGIADLNDEERQQLLLGRPLLRSVILGAVMLGRTASGDEPLPMLLARAYKNPDAHHEIFTRLGEVYEK